MKDSFRARWEVCSYQCEDCGMNPVSLTGQLVCKDSHEVSIVAQHLPLHIELTRGERGCLSFEVNPTQDPLIWQVDEQFHDAASFRTHQQRVEASAWGKATTAITRHYEITGL